MALVAFETRDWERWAAAPRFSFVEVGEGRGLLLLKAPLGERYEDWYGGEARVFTVQMVVERVQREKRRLGGVVDATLRSSKFHDVREWDDWDVPLTALSSRRGPCDRFRDAAPTNAELDAAVAAITDAWKRPSVVAVFSVDGTNTCGCVAVAALAAVGMPPAEALARVCAVRPIFSARHVARLAERFGAAALAAAAAAPPPSWYGDAAGDVESDDEADAPEAAAVDAWVAADAAAAAAPPPSKKRERDAPAAPATKRPRLRPAPAAPPPAAAPPPPAPPAAHRLTLVAPDGKRTLLATFESTLALCPPDLEATPDGYEKDLAKVNALPSAACKITADPAKLLEFVKYLAARKKAAIVHRGPPRIYLPPQTPDASGTLVLHYRP